MLVLASGCTGAETAEEGDTVYVQYTGTFNNGTVFDQSEPAEPLVFTLGQSSMIPGFEDAVYGMEIKETKNIHLTPEQAYGYYDSEKIFTIGREQIPENVEIFEGAELIMSGEGGAAFRVKVLEIGNDTVVIDANHPMAGKELNFEISLEKIEKANK